jgi:hypothetical protein
LQRFFKENSADGPGYIHAVIKSVNFRTRETEIGRAPTSIALVFQYHGRLNFVGVKLIECSQCVFTCAHNETGRKQRANQITADHRGKDFTQRTCQVSLYPMTPMLRDGPKLGFVPGHATGTSRKIFSYVHRGVCSVSTICYPHDPKSKLWISTSTYKCYEVPIAKSVYVIKCLRKPSTRI